MSVRAQIDAALDRGEGLGCILCLSEPDWLEFKRDVPRREYRKRQGTRFVNAYRGVPISIHDEWSWGWLLMTCLKGAGMTTQHDTPSLSVNVGGA